MELQLALFTPARAMAVSLLPLFCLANEELRRFARSSNGRNSSWRFYKDDNRLPGHTLELEFPVMHKKGNERTASRRLKKDRIIGGTPVDEGEYPFYAFPRGMMLCGATLISPQILLTAAHCGGVWTSGALIGEKHCYLPAAIGSFIFSVRLIKSLRLYRRGHSDFGSRSHIR